MVGAYVSLLLITNSGLPYYLAIPITMVFCAVLGVVIERLAYKPLRSAPRISALITGHRREHVPAKPGAADLLRHAQALPLHRHFHPLAVAGRRDELTCLRWLHWAFPLC